MMKKLFVCFSIVVLVAAPAERLLAQETLELLNNPSDQKLSNDSTGATLTTISLAAHSNSGVTHSALHDLLDSTSNDPFLKTMHPVALVVHDPNAEQFIESRHIGWIYLNADSIVIPISEIRYSILPDDRIVVYTTDHPDTLRPIAVVMMSVAQEQKIKFAGVLSVERALQIAFPYHQPISIRTEPSVMQQPNFNFTNPVWQYTHTNLFSRWTNGAIDNGPGGSGGGVIQLQIPLSLFFGSH